MYINLSTHSEVMSIVERKVGRIFSSEERKIVVLTGCTDCSFMYLLNVLEKYSRYTFLYSTFSRGLLNVHDTVHFFTFFCRQDTNGVVWTDTSRYDLPMCTQVPKTTLNYATSTWNAELMRKAGLHVHGIIPRPVDHEMAWSASQRVTTNKVDFVMVAHASRMYTKDIPRRLHKYVLYDGTKAYLDRKGLGLVIPVLRELGLWSTQHIQVRSNISYYDTIHKELTEEEKYEIYASSRWYLASSYVEGFGLPPVEAMATGTPSVYINAHAFKDNLVGIPVDVEDVVELDTPIGAHRFHIPKVQELKYAITNALTMSKEEYDDIRYRALERSLQYRGDSVAKLIDEAISSTISRLYNA